MKLHLTKKNWKTRVLPPSISYNADVKIGKTLTDKLESLKINIKTQPGDRDSETVTIYVPRLWTGIPESLLEFVTLLHNIIRGHNLSTGPQKFGKTSNLIIGEVLGVF